MKIISFFSYKGGAGRSTLAYNTIPVLAKDFMHPTREHPMIILDMDIDSCGMTYLLNSPSKPLRIQEDNCVQTLLANRCSKAKTPTIKEHPVLGKFCPVGNAFGYEDDEAILLVPAMHGKRIDEGAVSSYTDKNRLGPMDSFVDCCDLMGVSAILLDSSVGDNLTALISNELADIIVCCMRPTRQFRDGTISYLRRISKNGISSEKDIIVVPNVVPTIELIIENKRYPEEAIFQINNAFKYLDHGNHEYHLDLLDEDCFGVPALNRFMWSEDILRNLDTLTPEEELVLSRYTMIAEIIDNI